MPADGAMRVCIPVGVYPPQFGGHGIQIRRSLPFLRARGIVPTILAERLPRGQQRLAPDEELHVHRILVPGRWPISILPRAARFRRYFARRGGSFDLVHSAFLGWEFMLNIPYLKARGLPLIVEMVLLGGDDPLTISRERLGTLKLNLLRKVDGWIGIASAFLPRLGAVGIPQDRVRVIRGGVDVALYRPLVGDERRAARSRLGIPAESRVVVTVGGVIPRKGIDRVISAWIRTSPVPGRDLLLIIGPDRQADGLNSADLEYAKRMKRLALESGSAAGTIRFLGRADNLEAYMGSADLFLFLSRQEGLGYVILEAQSCGLPCIVSPLDGISSEVVTEGRTGFIMQDPDNSVAVAACITRLLAHPALRATISEEARRTAAASFSFDARADALTTFYHEILERRAG